MLHSLLRAAHISGRLYVIMQSCNNYILDSQKESGFGAGWREHPCHLCGCLEVASLA